MIARLVLFALFFLAQPAFAQHTNHLRIATYNADLSRKGPGLLLRDIKAGTDPQVAAVVSTLADLNADILVLTDVDFDHNLVALSALADNLAKSGAPYPYRFAKLPNTGMPTGLDLDGDGRLGGPRDAQGFGYFSGQGGIAVLSRLPIDAAAFRDFSGFLWLDLPNNLIGDSLGDQAKQVQRLSTTAHWDVPIVLPNNQRLHLLIWHATPPVFDGPNDRNGRRNHDEAAFWLALLENDLQMEPPEMPFVILGDANLDPIDGDGRHGALRALLADPRIQDPAPAGTHNRTDPDQSGDPKHDTALFDFGGLRVDFVLPSTDLRVMGSGIVWPDDAAPNAAMLARASRHRPVWVDIALP